MTKKHFVATGLIYFDKKVLLVKHRQLNKWLPPGGHIEENELPEEALLREITEETKCKVKIISTEDNSLAGDGIQVLKNPLCILTEIVNTPPAIHYHIDMVYVCQATSPHVVLDFDEIEDIGWFELEELSTLDTFSNLPSLVRKGYDYLASHNTPCQG